MCGNIYQKKVQNVNLLMKIISLKKMAPNHYSDLQTTLNNNKYFQLNTNPFLDPNFLVNDKKN